MRVQGVISLNDDQVDHLFGKLGTHSKCAGATLWLRDAFFADYRGRKVTISAPSRRVAACAIRTLLFHLSTNHGTDAALTSLSTWNYIDKSKGEAHGPYPFQKMLRWAEQNAFHDDSLPVQHSILLCWIPLWCLPLLGELANINLNSFLPLNEPEEVAMEDWEMTVRQLNEERSKGLLHDSKSTIKQQSSTTHSGTTTTLSDFPELQQYHDTTGRTGTFGNNITTSELDTSSAAPMDYELSHAIQFDVAPDTVRAFVVVDTNILLSHMSFTERVFEKLAASGPRVEVLLLVPWIVLSELDRLKDAAGGGRARSDAARLALRRIRSLTADRDAFVHLQSAAEHEKVVNAGDLPSEAQLHRELRNDDLILQTCLHWHRGAVAVLRAAGHRAAVFLLSNDKGLCARAEANGVKCFAAMEFPGTVEALAEQVPVVKPVSMDEAEAPAAALEKKVAKIEIKDTYSTENNKQAIVASEHGVNLPREATKGELIKGQPAAAVTSNAAPPSPSPPAQQQPEQIIQRNPPEKHQIVKHTTHIEHHDPVQRLESIIERCLAPGVKYYRQQDLGDLWIEMLEERSRPPWRAATVLDVICSHSTTFWEFLTRKELEEARELEKIIKRSHGHWHTRHGHRGQGSTSESANEANMTENCVVTAIAHLMHIMVKLLAGLDTPRQDGGDAPDPAEVPDFVSLGYARAALQEGIQEIMQLGVG